MLTKSRVRVYLGASIGIIFVVLFSIVSLPVSVSAAQITNRSLTLQAGASDGGSKPGGVVNHFFAFTVATTANIGSIKFEYCTQAAGSCITPAGLDTSTATLGSENGATGFAIDTSVNGAPFLTRSPAQILSGTPLTYQLAGVTNPTAANTSFYVRITTYTSTTATGGITDSGNVAASTANPVVVTGTMPESLIFCTGGTVGSTSGIPDCSTATSGSVTFNQLFSPTSTATASSQMAASTNAGAGYAITVNGPTLTSGSNTITAMSSSTTAVHGLSQFGLNLRLNTTATSPTPVGADVTPTSNGTSLRGEALSGYSTVDNFKFVSSDAVADSAQGGAGPTDAQIFTVSYIVNVPGSQPAGTYTSTLTYICTPTF